MNTLLYLLSWLVAGKTRMIQGVQTRWQTQEGVEVTGETIGWLIAAVILVLAGIYVVINTGIPWMQSTFDTIKSINPNSPGSAK